MVGKRWILVVTIGIVNKRFEMFYFFSSPTFRAQLTEIL
jgi:hypothetical protein